MTYAEHRAWLEQERDGFEAERTGFLSAGYDVTINEHWYENQPVLRRRFELGFQNGKALLARERMG